MIVIILITLFAAIVNGGLGYGFSSITVPVALLYYSNRILNPALVLVEIGANSYTLLSNRKSIRRVWKRVRTVVLGLVPAVVVGSFLLRSLDATWIKLFTYCFFVPLILLQSFGVRRPIRTESLIGVPFGGAIGILYSLTTISGPPLAMMLNNEGFEKEDFKAAIGIIRIVESVCTAAAYYGLGLFSFESMKLFCWIIPSVLIGMPLGSFALNKVDAAVFRRVCISLDAWLIAFGLFRIQHGLRFVSIAIVLIDLVVAIRFFRQSYLLQRSYRSDRPRG